MVEAEGNTTNNENTTERKPVFYMYDEAMMQHQDYNYHDEQGKIKENLPPVREEDFCSPEVPFRIKAIYEYLKSQPESNPLLPQLIKLEIEDMEWEQTLLKVHP